MRMVKIKKSYVKVKVIGVEMSELSEYFLMYLIIYAYIQTEKQLIAWKCLQILINVSHTVYKLVFQDPIGFHFHMSPS